MQQLPPEWDAVLRLQNKVLQFSSNSSFEHQAYDDAVGLALERLDEDPSYIAHNAYRHAKTTISRRSSTELSDDIELDQLPAQDLSLWRHHDQQNLIIRLLQLAEKTGQKVLSCIIHWLEGFSIEESASSLKITSSAFKKIRQRFKAKAKATLLG